MTMDKFLSFCQRTWSTQWVSIVGWGIALIVAVFVARSNADYDRAQQAEIDAQIRSVEAFEIAAAQYQTLGALYFDYIDVHGEASAEHRTAIIRNLTDQMAALDMLEQYSDNQDAIDEYRRSLVELRSNLSYDGDISSLDGFWLSTSQLLEARRPVLDSVDPGS